MAYVDKSEYEALSGNEMSEDEYTRKSAYADAYIDSVTLDRVGKAVADNEELPQSVKLVYCLIIDETEAFTSTGERVSSYSNGEDSYSFDLSDDAQTRIEQTAYMLLPVEWISCCMGGCHAR